VGVWYEKSLWGAQALLLSITLIISITRIFMLLISRHYQQFHLGQNH